LRDQFFVRLDSLIGICNMRFAGFSRKNRHVWADVRR